MFGMTSIVLPLFLAITLSFVRARSAAPPIFGAELSFVPYGTADIVPVAPGGWSASNGSMSASALPWGTLRNPTDEPAPIDGDGWPTCDAYIVIAIARTWASVDKTLFLAQYGGNFTLSFHGSVSGVVVPPQLNATISNVTFDSTSFTTSLRLMVPQPAPGAYFGIVVGFYGSRRNASAPVGSGLTMLSVVPDRQLGNNEVAGASHFWGAPLRAAAAPLHHVRTMQVIRVCHAHPDCFDRTLRLSLSCCDAVDLWMVCHGTVYRSSGVCVALGSPCPHDGCNMESRIRGEQACTPLFQQQDLRLRVCL